MTQRRDILRTCLRGGALLALGGVASTLGWRSRHGHCPHTNPCGGCPLLDGCGLPKALDAKHRGTPDPASAVAKPTSGHV